MRKRLHHIAPLFFLSFLLLPFTVLVFLQGAQWYLVSSVGKRMKSEKTEMVVLDAATVIWEKPGKELWVNGTLFDVDHYSVSGNALTAVGFFDKEETRVFNLLTLWQRAKNGGVLQQLFLLFQFFAVIIVMVQPTHPLLKGLLRQRHFLAYLPDPFLLVLRHPPR